MGILSDIEVKRGGGGDWIRIFSEELNPGIYDAKLDMINPCKVDDYNDRSIKKDGIEFIYTIDFGDGSDPIVVTRQVPASLNSVGNKSNFYKDLSGMMGDRLTDEIMEDDLLLEDEMEKLIGKTFSIIVGTKMSKKNKAYAAFDGVIAKAAAGRAGKPAPAKAVVPVRQTSGPTPEETAPHTDEDVAAASAVDEDDIPF